MTLPKPKNKTGKEFPEIGMEYEKYPYGLRLRLEKEQIDKLPVLQKIEAGAEVNISAKGKVMEVRVTDKAGGDNRHFVEIQIQSIGIPDKEDFGNAFKEAMNKKENTK